MPVPYGTYHTATIYLSAVPAGPAYQLMTEQLNRFQQASLRWTAARYRLSRAGQLTQGRAEFDCHSNRIFPILSIITIVEKWTYFYSSRGASALNENKLANYIYITTDLPPSWSSEPWTISWCCWSESSCCRRDSPAGPLFVMLSSLRQSLTFMVSQVQDLFLRITDQGCGWGSFLSCPDPKMFHLIQIRILLWLCKVEGKFQINGAFTHFTVNFFVV